jgi:hypothetical protein
MSDVKSLSAERQWLVGESEGLLAGFQSSDDHLRLLRVVRIRVGSPSLFSMFISLCITLGPRKSFAQEAEIFGSLVLRDLRAGIRPDPFLELFSFLQ